MTSTTSHSKFLAYLEQRKSLTQSQSSRIARTLQDEQSHLTSSQSSSSFLYSQSSTPSPTSSTRSISPSSPTCSSLLSSSSSSRSIPPSTTTSPQPPHHHDQPAPDTYSTCPPFIASSLPRPPAPHDALQSTTFRSPFSSDDREEKETILLRSHPSSSSSLPPLLNTSLVTSSPLLDTSPSYLVQRELSSLHHRLRATEESRAADNNRLQLTLHSAQDELNRLKAENDKERSERLEWERDRERIERDKEDWKGEKEQMQKEVDRMTSYMAQLASSSSASYSATIASSALTHVANNREAAANKRLKVKINRLIDEVNSRATQLARQVKEVEGLREEMKGVEGRLRVRDEEVKEMEGLRRENQRMKAYETDYMRREMEMKEIRRARAFYALKEEELTKLRGRDGELAAANRALTEEVQWRRERMGVLEEENEKMKLERKAREDEDKSELDNWQKRAEEAERQVEESMGAKNYHEDKCRSLQREMKRMMEERGVDVSGMKRDAQWMENERQVMEAKVSSLEAEVMRLQVKNGREERGLLTGSGSAGVASELRRMRDAGSGLLHSAVSALDAVIPPASDQASTPVLVTPVVKRRKKRATVGGGEVLVSGPSSVFSASASIPTPATRTSPPRRRASLPQPSPLQRSASTSVVTMPIKPSLKGPIKGIHPMAVTSTPARSSSSHSLTSSGGSAHRVRFATPIAVETKSTRGSPLSRGRAASVDRGGKEQPSTPTSASFRFKDAFLHFF